MSIDLPQLTDLMAQFGDRDAAADVDLTGDIGDVAFDDLGFDSLSRFNVLAHLEREYGLKLPLDSVLAAATPNELMKVINHQN